MASTDDILVNNLSDALQQAQRYLLFGVTSAALLLVLTIENVVLHDSESKIQVPSIGAVNPELAVICFVVGYLAFGILANSACGRAFHVAQLIQDPKVAEAAMLRYSFATAESRMVRVGTALLPPFLILVGYLVEVYRSDASFRFSDRVAYQILGYLFLCAPYLTLAMRLVSQPTLASLKAISAAAKNKWDQPI